MSVVTEAHERPILFSGAMVRAILEGRKTQTRRVVKPPRGVDPNHWSVPCFETAYAPFQAVHWPADDAEFAELVCPYGEPGDRLWVRESWSLEACGGPYYEITYRADRSYREIEATDDADNDYLTRLYDTQQGDWRPSVHMPRRFSRLLLEVKSVRIERLQAISEDDALAEGVEPPEEFDFFDTRENNRTWFARLWESINGEGSWAANPWVWAVRFRPIVTG